MYTHTHKRLRPEQHGQRTKCLKEHSNCPASECSEHTQHFYLCTLNTKKDTFNINNLCPIISFQLVKENRKVAAEIHYEPLLKFNSFTNGAFSVKIGIVNIKLIPRSPCSSLSVLHLQGRFYLELRAK